MSHGLASPTAMHRAVVDRARNHAASGRSGELVAKFYYGRFLRRVFQGNGWVLKGGNAMLARAADARHTNDIDLLLQDSDIDGAVEELRRLAEVDVDGDEIRFQIVRKRGAGTRTQQPDVGSARLQIEAFCGAKRTAQFGVDLVVGSLMTSEPDILPAAGPHLIPTLPAPQVRIYPVVDHIADKVAATEATYSGGQQSQRVRDLVDLVVFTRTANIDGQALHTAITAERAHRQLPQLDAFDVPPDWASTYPRVATGTTWCHDVPTVIDALTVVRRLLVPAMTGAAIGSRWVAVDQAWTPSPQGRP
jgi:hypothetical protein